MKFIFTVLALISLAPVHASEDLSVAMIQQIDKFAQTDHGTADDINSEWYLYRRMVRFSVSGQVSVGLAKVELTPEIEIIQER